MGERLVTSLETINDFYSKVGYLPKGQTVEHYPLHHQDRVVVRVESEGRNQILKFRPAGEQTNEEYNKLVQLYNSYRYHEVPVDEPRFLTLDAGYSVIEMDYLGIDVRQLAQDLDCTEYGLEPQFPWFKGFPADEIINLVDICRRAHYLYTLASGRIHGDIFDNKGINNIVYNPALHRLMFVDAEALGRVTDEKIIEFHQKMDSVHEWMRQNLLAKVTEYTEN